jgi:2-polyprenylphenol 6-hydroxylase
LTDARTPIPAYDVAIVGGGMVGAAAACALGGSSLKVALIERLKTSEAPSDEYDLRVSALTLATQTMFEALGGWSGIARRRYARVAAMQIWDAGGAGEIRFDAADIGEPYLALIVENRVVVTALRERLHAHTNVHLIDRGVAEVKLGEQNALLTLSDDRQLHARLVVAADGADSAVRESLGIRVRSLDMRQQGIVATVRTERVHEETARQKFLATGPLAFLPLSDAHTSSIVWSADLARAQELLALDDTAFRTALQTAFGDRLGAIRAVSARAAFPLTLAHADEYVRNRVALIGDAAHTVHPLAGQGVNLGFLDAAALAEVALDAARERRDIGAYHVLRRYERWRKGDNLAMLAVTGGFKFLFGNDWPALSGLRNLGLTVTDRVDPLKTSIMRRACGLTGDLPRLARRENAVAG